ncbi:hypothetical protein GE115_00105 [Agromyces sp. CFH 90414]|uniref:Uncharacterized protein n=1 Tax=Agromyces agglutinans TaxID=2662258 RepID=A0A6I2F8G6_9MICO|nr:hypothetical protein [Agromyces agglutinans]MRG58283.1 hypothetical protein [Agromyces agglutinans]
MWQLADELERAPMVFHDLPERAREYIAAWVRTVDHGCGHPAPVHVSMMPGRSAVCPACALALGFDTQVGDRCGPCRAPLGAHGIVTAFAISPRSIAFVALCAECAGTKTPGTPSTEEGSAP